MTGMKPVHVFNVIPSLPAALEGRQYYRPTERGFEKEIRRRLDLWAEGKKRR